MTLFEYKMCVAVFLVFIILEGILFLGHQSREKLDKQFINWFDGVNTYDMFGKEYYNSKPEVDTFLIEYYNNTNSVASAVKFIKMNYDISSDEKLFLANFDFVSKRFIHYMYPHHNYYTNPFLAFLEDLFPKKPFNAMMLADDKLRHTAAGGCGDVSNVFIEIYRSFGKQARIVAIKGHVVVEAKVENEIWFVDADQETFYRGTVDAITKDTNLVDKLYKYQKKEKIELFKRGFGGKIVYIPWTGAPSDSPRIYYMHALLFYIKWFVYPLFGLILCLFIRKRVVS